MKIWQRYARGYPVNPLRVLTQSLVWGGGEGMGKELADSGAGVAAMRPRPFLILIFSDSHP